MLIRMIFALLVIGLVGGAGAGVYRMLQKRQPLPQAMALMERRDPRGAQAILRRLVRDEPRNGEAHVLLARTQLDLHDAVAAEKELRIARALRYERVVINPMLARALLMQGKSDDVLTELPATAMRTEELVPNLVMRSLAYLREGDVQEAATSIDGAARLAPEDPGVLVGEARIALARAETAKARMLLDRAMLAAPNDTDGLMLMGDIRLQQGDPEGAMGALSRAIELTPFSVEARLQRAVLRMRLGRDAEALEDVGAALDVDRNDGSAMMTRAMLMMRAGKYGDAMASFQKLSPAMFEKFPRLYFLIAQTSSLSGQETNALNIVNRYLRLQPGNVDGVNLAGSLLIRLSRTSEALELLSRTIAGGTGTALTYDLLGRAQFILGETDAAVKSYQRASAMDPGNKDYAAHLAAAETRFGVAPDLAARLSVPEPVVTRNEVP